MNKNGHQRNIQVKQGEITKIALLISFLINLPRAVYFYRVTHLSLESFKEGWMLDLLTNSLFLFVFSWIALQINANIPYRLRFTNRIYKILFIILSNLVLLIGAITVLKFGHPLVVGDFLTVEERKFIDFKFSSILLIILFIARILRLKIAQRENLLENEYLKQQNLQNELIALKNQINPHFLFNSLNTLASLVREDKEATTFINKLSYMYRYILQSSDRNLVSVREELKFLESYNYLIKTRYRDRFTLLIDIPEALQDTQIPPLALQLLVENAVKHNEISEEFPLTVHIYTKEGFLFVENKLRFRSSLEDSTGNGLVNLSKRYFLLLKQEITVHKEDHFFSVRLPLQVIS
ncbi:histidine kinase [Arenibacter sp. GZD96]|uniref:sensor histidine kinase n=1 Tax=Aurantibrevibacter litoralis TaxID=3106030 RepID=UPI002AFE6EEB|nr:histidine kinase [Arenibacter sp. GZD-96]MEA1785010.1 histidine kinase [Arenibacter sp. GZD-96]